MYMFNGYINVLDILNILYTGQDPPRFEFTWRCETKPAKCTVCPVCVLVHYHAVHPYLWSYWMWALS